MFEKVLDRWWPFILVRSIMCFGIIIIMILLYLNDSSFGTFIFLNINGFYLGYNLAEI